MSASESVSVLAEAALSNSAEVAEQNVGDEVSSKSSQNFGLLRYRVSLDGVGTSRNFRVSDIKFESSLPSVEVSVPNILIPLRTAIDLGMDPGQPKRRYNLKVAITPTLYDELTRPSDLVVAGCWDELMRMPRSEFIRLRQARKEFRCKMWVAARSQEVTQNLERFSLDVEADEVSSVDSKDLQDSDFEDAEEVYQSMVYSAPTGLRDLRKQKAQEKKAKTAARDAERVRVEMETQREITEAKVPAQLILLVLQLHLSRSVLIPKIPRTSQQRTQNLLHLLGMIQMLKRGLILFLFFHRLLPLLQKIHNQLLHTILFINPLKYVLQTNHSLLPLQLFFQL
jgi:hypothetical protein